MKLIVGLGNPGEDYSRSRHNVGWVVADAFARKFRIDMARHEKESMTGEGRVAGGTVKVAKPLTYMNLSGDAVRLLVNAYLESTDDLMVVYDEIDLPLGTLRIRPNGSAGTHNGMCAVRITPTFGCGTTSSTTSPTRSFRSSRAPSSVPSTPSSSSPAAT
jgi:PTH1 family peptidyl-tRNA hydrolase